MVILKIDWSSILVNSLGEGLGALGVLCLLTLISLLFNPVRGFWKKIISAAYLTQAFHEYQEKMKMVEDQNKEMYQEFKINHSQTVEKLQNELEAIKHEKQTKMEKIMEQMQEDVHNISLQVGKIKHLEKEHSIIKKSHHEIRKIVMESKNTLQKLMDNQKKAA